MREETAVDTTGDGLDDTTVSDSLLSGFGNARIADTPEASRDASPKHRRAGSTPSRIRGSTFAAASAGAAGAAGTVDGLTTLPLAEARLAGSASPGKRGGKAPILVKDDDRGGHTHELMLSMADQLRHGSGLIIAAAIIPLAPGQDYDDQEAVLKSEAEKTLMSRLMKTMGVQGFCMTVLAREVSEGRSHAIQCAGLGPLSPNTILMGWPWWWKAKPTRFVPEFM